MLQPLVESDVLLRAQGGDREAFTELVWPFHSVLLQVARRVVRQDEDAEEVVQEALLKAYQHISAYRGEAALSTWLVRIVINQAFMLLRRRRPDSVGFEEVHVETHRFCAFWSSEQPTPEELCAFRQETDLLRDCLNRMRPTYRMVLSLKALDDKSHEEIAETLAIPVKTVRVRLHRARRELQRMLTRRTRQHHSEQ